MKLEPDIRGRIIELNHQMEIFDYFNAVKLGSLLLKHSDNVSRTIQHSYMSIADCQLVVALATKTAQTRFFYSFRKNVRKLQQKWIQRNLSYCVKDNIRIFISWGRWLRNFQLVQNTIIGKFTFNCKPHQIAVSAKGLPKTVMLMLKVSYYLQQKVTCLMSIYCHFVIFMKVI